MTLQKYRWIAGAAALYAAGASAAGAAALHPRQTSRAAHRAKPRAQVDAILDNVIDRLWGRADWYWHEGRYEERVAVDRIVIRMDPGFIEPYSTAGWLLESLGRDQEALALYRQAVATVPGRWETHQDLAMFLYQHKEYAAAAEEFRRATQHSGAPVYVWKMLAHAYERAGALQQAVDTWEAAARVDPNDPAVGVNLRRVRARLSPPPKE